MKKKIQNQFLKNDAVLTAWDLIWKWEIIWALEISLGASMLWIKLPWYMFFVPVYHISFVRMHLSLDSSFYNSNVFSILTFSPNYNGTNTDQLEPANSGEVYREIVWKFLLRGGVNFVVKTVRIAYIFT